MNAIVVGGGIAGLVAARELARAGMTVTVFESSTQLGGTIAAAELGGVLTDTGAEAFGVARPEVLELISELGLDAQVIDPARTDAHLWTSKGLHPIPRGILGIPADLDAPEVVAIIGPKAVKDARAKDAAALEDIPADISLGELVRLRLGDAVADKIVTPVVAGVHAADPDTIEAAAVLPNLMAKMAEIGSLCGAVDALRAASGRPGSAVAGLAGGMTTLVEALKASMPEVTFRTQRTITGVRRTKTGWLVENPDVALRTDRVVLAVSPRAAAKLIKGEPKFVETLVGLEQGDVAVVSLVVKSRDLDKGPVGSGVLVDPSQKGVKAKAMTHSSAKWDWVAKAYGPGTHLLRLSYGRNGVIEEDLEILPKQARKDAEKITGITFDDVIDVKVTRWSDSLIRQGVGHTARLAAVRSHLAKLEGLGMVGAGFGGNGIAGTIASARTAVEQVTPSE